VSAAVQHFERVPFAHTGHVLVDLLMFAPVLALVVWFAFVSVRDRRRGPDRDSGRR
jgi:hypothetical protein